MEERPLHIIASGVPYSLLATFEPLKIKVKSFVHSIQSRFKVA
jgi:hypothetical protein